MTKEVTGIIADPCSCSAMANDVPLMRRGWCCWHEPQWLPRRVQRKALHSHVRHVECAAVAGGPQEAVAQLLRGCHSLALPAVPHKRLYH